MFDSTFIWIGLWTNFSNIINLIESHGETMYENIQRNDLSKFIDPVVCIGTCLPILSPPLT